ncbi:DUF3990 domain-containing protein [Clostridium sp. ZBS15]|uniref:DUF3990 domain-containing protein n=1 Tax=Clostridium sp. ZBS15 TaxID=2949969 RepID=UPI00207A3E6A|nr:DUF3990 domain-containing protein [Clostridium sp. ZBS15]
MLEIYHGSNAEIELPKLLLDTKFNKDFGEGFYCTNIKKQAIRWAIRKGRGSGFVSKYEYNYLKTIDLNTLRFNVMTEEWLDFIIACRVGKKHSYDIVEGPMADDEIYNYINDYMDGIISRTAFWELAKFKHPTHQLCFCTKKSLECLDYEGSELHEK